MSTRANVIIKDSNTVLVFYRHSDGYPKATGADLAEFVQGYYSGAMRADAMQSAGWLILRGHKEYLENKPFTARASLADRGYGWKVGAYEPTERLHGDVEYVYIIDLVENKLSCFEPNADFWEKPFTDNMRPCAEFPPISFAKDAESA